MTGKERTVALFNRKPADRVGFWLGNPHDETKKKYYQYFNVGNDEELGFKLGNDYMWIMAEWNAWKHPEGKPIFDVLGGKERTSLNQSGVFADCEDIKEVEAFDWPNPDYLDFTSTIELIDSANSKGMGVVGGMWTAFFHVVCDFFGMENYFVKMYTDPDVVEAVTEKVVDFYLEANRRCFEAMAPKLDAFFFGNDFGSQEDLLISEEMFKRFVLPGFKKSIDLAKSYGLKVMLHSCGAISKVIPLLIDAGIDALHPLQAKAKGMDAEKLAREYKNDLLFVGGVDTQELLPFGTPEQIKAEVRRLKKVFGERFIVSPSHEALLPNVSPENLIAMMESALE